MKEENRKYGELAYKLVKDAENMGSRLPGSEGERKYAELNDPCEIALWSYRIAFSHPKTGKKMEFLIEPPEVFPWTAC